MSKSPPIPAPATSAPGAAASFCRKTSQGNGDGGCRGVGEAEPRKEAQFFHRRRELL